MKHSALERMKQGSALKKGISVEKEHKDLYNELKKRLKEQGVIMPITEEQFYAKIAKAHLKERKDYYDLLEKYVEKYSAKKKMREGGVDLFEDQDNLPDEVQEILQKYEQGFEDGDYAILEKAKNELEEVGYTFEYYVDGQAYDLRKIGEVGKVEYAEKQKKMDGGDISAEELKEIYDYLDSIHARMQDDERVFHKTQNKFPKVKGPIIARAVRDYMNYKNEKMKNGGDLKQRMFDAGYVKKPDFISEEVSISALPYKKSFFDRFTHEYETLNGFSEDQWREYAHYLKKKDLALRYDKLDDAYIITNPHGEGKFYGTSQYATFENGGLVDAMRNNIPKLQAALDNPTLSETAKKNIKERLDYLNKVVTGYDAFREQRSIIKPTPAPAEPKTETKEEVVTEEGRVDSAPVSIESAPKTGEQKYYIIVELDVKQKVKDALWYRNISYTTVRQPGGANMLIVEGKDNLDIAYEVYSKYREKLGHGGKRKESVTGIYDPSQHRMVAEDGMMIGSQPFRYYWRYKTTLAKDKGMYVKSKFFRTQEEAKKFVSDHKDIITNAFMYDVLQNRKLVLTYKKGVFEIGDMKERAKNGGSMATGGGVDEYITLWGRKIYADSVNNEGVIRGMKVIGTSFGDKEGIIKDIEENYPPDKYDFYYSFSPAKKPFFKKDLHTVRILEKSSGGSMATGGATGIDKVFNDFKNRESFDEKEIYTALQKEYPTWKKGDLQDKAHTLSNAIENYGKKMETGGEVKDFEDISHHASYINHLQDEFFEQVEALSNYLNASDKNLYDEHATQLYRAKNKLRDELAREKQLFEKTYNRTWDDYMKNEVHLNMNKKGNKVKYEGYYKGIHFEGEGEFEKSGKDIYSKIESEFESRGDMTKEDMQKIRQALLKGLKEEGVEFKKGGSPKSKFTICPVGTKIQTLIFNKDNFTKKQAKDWAKKHDERYGYIDEKENTYRIRQREPETFVEDSFRTITLTKGVQAVIGCPKK